jgi:hypothetical protein
MAEKFTEAGQIGKDIRSKLGSAVKAAGSGAKWGYSYINDFITEYGQEPFLNLYPQAVNLFAAGGETVAGMADKPVNLGRFPYYDLKTQFDKREEQKQVAAPVETQEEIPTITVSKKAERPQKLWRLMSQGGDASQDTFYDTKEAADAALKKMGGKGAVAGIRFPAKSKEEESALKEQYMQRAAMGGKVATTPKADETEEEAIKRQVREVNPQATPAQQQNYYNTLTASRARGKEREAASKERYAKFRSDIAAKETSSDQLNQYNKQLSALRGAYREARRAGDYVEQYRLGDFINSYQAGIPKEMGARERASRSGMIAQKNKELEEKIIRDREARIAAERTSMANPDFQQFVQGKNPQYAPGGLQSILQETQMLQRPYR